MHMRGFTLIELLLVFALISVFARFTAPFNSQVYRTYYAERAAGELVDMLHTAHDRSVQQYHDSVHGVHITEDTLTLFEGTTYASRDTTYDETYALPDNVTISGTTDIVFTAYTGRLSAEHTVDIQHGPVVRTVHINEFGIITSL